MASSAPVVSGGPSSLNKAGRLDRATPVDDACARAGQSAKPGRRATERLGPLGTDGVMVFNFETERPDATVHVRVAEGTIRV